MLTHVYMEWVPLLVSCVKYESWNWKQCLSSAGLVVAVAVTVAFVKHQG